MSAGLLTRRLARRSGNPQRGLHLAALGYVTLLYVPLDVVFMMTSWHETDRSSSNFQADPLSSWMLLWSMRQID